MASSRRLIASQTLGSSAASVTFSSIPSTYKDLVLKVSARHTSPATFSTINVTFNGNTSNIYSLTMFRGNGSTVDSQNSSNTNPLAIGTGINAAASTANTFNNLEIYIPSYTASQNKPVSSVAVAETNDTLAYIRADAHLFRSTSAISTILIDANSFNFVSGSTFQLYGLAN